MSWPLKPAERWCGNIKILLYYEGRRGNRGEYTAEFQVDHRLDGHQYRIPCLQTGVGGVSSGEGYGYEDQSPEAYDFMAESAVSWLLTYTSDNRSDDDEDDEVPCWSPPGHIVDELCDNEAEHAECEGFTIRRTRRGPVVFTDGFQGFQVNKQGNKSTMDTKRENPMAVAGESVTFQGSVGVEMSCDVESMQEAVTEQVEQHHEELISKEQAKECEQQQIQVKLTKECQATIDISGNTETATRRKRLEESIKAFGVKDGKWKATCDLTQQTVGKSDKVTFLTYSVHCVYEFGRVGGQYGTAQTIVFDLSFKYPADVKKKLVKRQKASEKAAAYRAAIDALSHNWSKQRSNIRRNVRQLLLREKFKSMPGGPDFLTKLDGLAAGLNEVMDMELATNRLLLEKKK